MEQQTCAFCYEPGGRTTVVCGCKGGMQNVHLACLDKWTDSGATHCAACRQPYRDGRRFVRLPRIIQFRRLKLAIERLLDLFALIITNAYTIIVICGLGKFLMDMIRAAVLQTSKPCDWFDGLVVFACVVWIWCRYTIRLERNV
jgi:E3 ubiquitin-protein ligase DOA10